MSTSHSSRKKRNTKKIKYQHSYIDIEPNEDIPKSDHYDTLAKLHTLKKYVSTQDNKKKHYVILAYEICDDFEDVKDWIFKNMDGIMITLFEPESAESFKVLPSDHTLEILQLSVPLLAQDQEHIISAHLKRFDSIPVDIAAYIKRLQSTASHIKGQLEISNVHFVKKDCVFHFHQIVRAISGLELLARNKERNRSYDALFWKEFMPRPSSHCAPSEFTAFPLTRIGLYDSDDVALQKKFAEMSLLFKKVEKENHGNEKDNANKAQNDDDDPFL